jgi:hypothetical protein
MKATYALPRATLCLLIAGQLSGAVFPEPTPFKTPDRPPDAAQVLSPAATYVGGFLGWRIEVNAENRLAKVDLEPFLAGYRHKPGEHPWIGEHIGKWLHAATLAWANSNDATLRSRLDYAAAELIKAQEPDGYLGTYVPAKRFGLYENADWDVWSHKYCLIGLLTYYQYTGDAASLQACRKAGDLLIATFGPGKKSILSAGTHMGMAATSVLEPMVLLYRFTGEERYLDFAKYLVRAWDEPNGPKIIASLLAKKRVDQTANGKAYEMLSNLVGLCELARATGDRSFLEPVLNAWADVVAHRLYLTGSASAGEHFQTDYDLPNQMGASICETCVTVTWIQLNLELLRLTGEARFGHELERSFYNHLAAAQSPAGADWCYYTAMEGTKPYDAGITCCHSSGPRGIALIPQAAFLRYRAGGVDGLAVNLFEPARVEVQLSGATVNVDQQSEFPRRGRTTFRFYVERPVTFAFKVRAPAWAGPMQMQINGKPAAASLHDGWLELAARAWKNEDRVRLTYTVGPRLIVGEHGNAGKAALAWGPFVLAYDQKRNAGLPAGSAVALEAKASQVALLPGTVTNLTFTVPIRSAQGTATAKFVPFADAGQDGGVYRIWLRAPGAALPTSGSLLLDGQESRSRAGNQGGSINDGDPGTFVVTFNSRPAREDWFAVALSAPVTIRRVAFAHGRSFHDGGWFDTRSGKPQLQIKREKNAAWETVAEFADYPATTATSDGGLKPGARFVQKLPAPVKAVAVRVLGHPASGDNPAQAFASCGELEAFAN